MLLASQAVATPSPSSFGFDDINASTAEWPYRFIHCISRHECRSTTSRGREIGWVCLFALITSIVFHHHIDLDDFPCRQSHQTVHLLLLRHLHQPLNPAKTEFATYLFVDPVEPSCDLVYHTIKHHTIAPKNYITVHLRDLLFIRANPNPLSSRLADHTSLILNAHLPIGNQPSQIDQRRKATMNHSYRAVSSPGRLSMPSPAAPLALSDFILQRPLSPYSFAYDGQAAASPDATLAEGDHQSSQPQLLGETSRTRSAATVPMAKLGGDNPVKYPGLSSVSIGAPSPSQEAVRKEEGTSESLSTTTPLESPPPVTAQNWLATRQQIIPGRNVKKADWIRGWSESVVNLGNTTYCCCSESFTARGRGWKGKGGDLTSGVRAILPVTRSSSGGLDTAVSMCRNCHRPASPTPATGDFGPLNVDEPEEKVGRSTRTEFTRRLGGLLRRVMPSRSDSDRQVSQKHLDRNLTARSTPVSGAYGNRQQKATAPPVRPSRLSGFSAIISKEAPDNQPKMTKNSWSATPRQPAVLNGTRGGHNHLQSESDDESSDSDDPRAKIGLKVSYARLQRAAKLLERNKS